MAGQKNIKEARLQIVAELYLRGTSIRKIRAEVMRRLDLKSYSTQTVHADTHQLLREWREARIENTDLAVQLELERIDRTIEELWAEWERSKTNYTKKSEKQKGSPRKKKDEQTGQEVVAIETTGREKIETEVVCLGDVSYLSEIRQQLIERRKLLGLYAPEKRDYTLTEHDLTGLSEEQRKALLTIGEAVLTNNETRG